LSAVETLDSTTSASTNASSSRELEPGGVLRRAEHNQPAEPKALFYNFKYSESAYVYSIPILPTLGVRGEW